MRHRMQDLEELGRAQEALRLSGMMPTLRTEIDTLMRGVQNRVFQEINDGALTPQSAQLAWLEVHAMSRLLRRLEAQVKMGETVARQAEGE